MRLIPRIGQLGHAHAAVRRMSIGLAIFTFFGAIVAVTGVKVSAAPGDILTQQKMHWNSLTRYDKAPQYESESDSGPSGSYSQTAGPYYFDINYGQQFDFSIWRQAECPCYYYWEWNRTYGWSWIHGADNGGECGCAPFTMERPKAGTDEWEWYHHRHNQTRQVATNADTQKWVQNGLDPFRRTH